jgi:outer membrane protein TolC
MWKWVWPVALGGALLAGRAVAAPVPEKKPESPEVKKLLKERRDALRSAAVARTQEFEAGRGTLEVLLHVSRELLQAELELATNPKERFDAHASHFNAMRKVDEMVTEGYKAGRVKAADHYQMRAARLEAEVGLLRARAQLKEGKQRRPRRETNQGDELSLPNYLIR